MIYKCGTRDLGKYTLIDQGSHGIQITIKERNSPPIFAKAIRKLELSFAIYQCFVNEINKKIEKKTAAT